MPIFDQGYQHWQGPISGHAWRWLAVTRQGVRQQSRRKLTRWLVAVAFVPALVLAAVLVLWGLLEQQSSLLQPFMFLIQGLPDEIRNGPKAFRPAVWTFAFEFFFDTETLFAMLLVLTVGPDLVSQDLRFNAIPLYLSRPIRRLDYFLGKLGVIGVFLAAVAVAPAVLAYVLGLAFSLDLTVVKDTWRLLVGSIVYGLIVVLSAGTLMLAVSSLSRNSRLVGATWVVLWIVSNVTASVLQQTVQKEWCPLVSYTNNLDRLREELLDLPSARKPFLELWEKGREARERASRPLFPIGRNRRRRPPEPNRTPSVLETPENLRHPWTWSAGVLAGLFVVSSLTLATRVKSLDRLK
ncbi:MAG: ABC transporter permease subunit [Isosphaeraceae bacterium]